MGVFEKAIVCGKDIEKYIPQRYPMVMVDTFYGVSNQTSESGFTVLPDNIFYSTQGLDECALIENMAQSAALMVGFAHISRGESVPLGFIGAVSKFTLFRKAVVGEKLRTRIHVITEFGDITVANAEVSVDGDKVCESQLKIFLQPEQ